MEGVNGPLHIGEEYEALKHEVSLPRTKERFFSSKLGESCGSGGKTRATSKYQTSVSREVLKYWRLNNQSRRFETHRNMFHPKTDRWHYSLDLKELRELYRRKAMLLFTLTNVNTIRSDQSISTGEETTIDFNITCSGARWRMFVRNGNTRINRAGIWWRWC